MTSAFERHNEAVRAAIPKERLLEWTRPDGWEPICDRLGSAGAERAVPQGQHHRRVPGDGGDALPGATSRCPERSVATVAVDVSQNTLYRLL